MPYIPFKLVFGSGTTFYKNIEDIGDTIMLDFNMIPVFMSMGDYNNVLFKMNLLATDNEHFTMSFESMIQTYFIPSKKFLIMMKKILLKNI